MSILNVIKTKLLSPNKDKIIYPETYTSCVYDEKSGDRLDIMLSVLRGDQSSVLDLVYPIGSIYMSVNNVSPATLFGGTWEKIQDQFLLASGSTYTNGTSGGSADAIVPYHSHTFTGTAETHTHNFARSGTAINGNALLLYSDSSYDSSLSAKGFKTEDEYAAWTNTNKQLGYINSTSITPKGTNGYAGTSGNTTGANMPPYLTVNMWKRTA